MPTRRLIAVVVLVPLLATLALWAFAWPSARTAPRDLPIGVAGPATATAQVEQQLQQEKGAFEIHHYADESAARQAIEDRSVYGAVVVTTQGSELLTASAAGPLVAQTLEQTVAEDSGMKTVDVVPAAEKDPRGAALSSSVLPLALAGIVAGALVTLLGLRGFRAVTALVASAALVGVTAATLADSWLGILTGNWWAEAATLSFATLAVGAAVAGVAALIGTAGIGITAFTVMFLGNPFSGASSAPEMLPEPVGMIGQWLPPGATATLLRSVTFFDGAAALAPALTLACWATLGLGAVLLRRTPKAPASSTTLVVAGSERELVPVG